MNNLRDLKILVRNALNNLFKNKVRSILTSLGIFIGILSVVLLNSIGLGLKSYIQNQFESLGANLVIVMPGKVFAGGKFRATSNYQMVPIFSEKDISQIGKSPLTEMVAPAFVKFLEVKGEIDTKVYETILSNAEIFTVLNQEIDKGELFVEKDLNKKSKVAVLGSNVALQLFGDAENSVGREIKIESQSYKVLGVLKSKGGGGIRSVDDYVYLPYKGALSFNPDKKFLTIYAKTYNQNDLEKYKREITSILSKKFNADDFSVLDQREILTTVTSIFSVLNIVLISIAAISLVVGGIGIMNIMFVSVAERVKEIGIRRAYGATERDILKQFMAETIILSVFGGTLALIAAYLIITLSSRFFPLSIDIMTVVMAVSVSFAIGLIFGVVPAIKAARYTPIEAIRRD